ncbi:hypothetical protein ACIGXM_36500 [Kitasatospora sp. NPDC052896]|uniref:hypothetical protein n=1 Tax=Kitasatospora sp. NPDC052896 TaxID=3364061 RepID=UPI0037C892B4
MTTHRSTASAAHPVAVPAPRPAQPPPGQSTPYRMTVTTRQSHADVVALADQCLAVWLKREGHEEPPPLPDPAPPPPRSAAADQPLPSEAPPATRHQLADRVLLDRDGGALDAHPAGLPSGHYTRRRLRTPAPHGTHQLTLTVATEGDGPTWVRLEAAHRAADSGLRTPGRVPVPELAGSLLPLLDALDGPSEVRPLPRILTAADVDDVIDELCDPARRLPVVVASVPADLDPAAWTAERLRPLTRGLVGLAVCYVLGPEARVAFNLALEFHTVYGGAVRTYLPEVDPASRRDALRHPVLPRHRIEAEPRRAAALLAREPRRLAAVAPSPTALTRVPPLRPRPIPLRPSAGVPSADVSSVAAEPVGARQAPDVARRSELHLRASGGRLCLPDGGAPAPARWTEAGSDGPASFTALLDRMDEFSLLSFTGDEKETLALDTQTGGVNWVRLTWEGLTALQEYATVAVRGAAGGDFKRWCEHAPVGVSHFPPRKAVRNESQTVCSHAKMRRERMFAVPDCVDPTGRAFMGAHLRIGGGRTAPRLHYLDDCSGSGRIYVGYIGLHLTNTRTN